MERQAIRCAIALLAFLCAGTAHAVDMKEYQKHISKFHKYLDQAEALRAQGDLKGAADAQAKADQEKAWADVALCAPGKLPPANEPGPIVNRIGPYYNYWGWGWGWRGRGYRGYWW